MFNDATAQKSAPSTIWRRMGCWGVPRSASGEFSTITYEEVGGVEEKSTVADAGEPQAPAPAPDVLTALMRFNVKAHLTLPDYRRIEIFVPRDWTAGNVLRVYAPAAKSNDPDRYELIRVSSEGTVLEFVSERQSVLPASDPDTNEVYFLMRSLDTKMPSPRPSNASSRKSKKDKKPVQTSPRGGAVDIKAPGADYVVASTLTESLTPDSATTEPEDEKKPKGRPRSGSLLKNSRSGHSARGSARNRRTLRNAKKDPGTPPANATSTPATSTAPANATGAPEKKDGSEEEVANRSQSSEDRKKWIATGTQESQEFDAFEQLPEYVVGARITPRNCSYDQFEVFHTIGFATFGRVRVAMRKDHEACSVERDLGRTVGGALSIKIVSKEVVLSGQHLERLKNEREIMQLVSHPFITHLYYTFQDSKRLFFVTDYANGGELCTHMQLRGQLPEMQALFYAAETSLAVGYLHTLNIIFRNVRPENIVLDRRGHIRISDFGVAKVLRGNARTWTICGTPHYLCPEMVTNSGHGKGADWWAIGVLIYEMLMGYPPYDHDNLISLYEMIAHPRTKIAFPKTLSRLPKDLIKQMLAYNPSRRIGARESPKEVVEHKWFKVFDWQELYQMNTPTPYVPETEDEFDTGLYEVYPESNESSGKECFGDEKYFGTF